MKKYGKIIIFDTLALLCFIGVVLFGWLPGPGGVPLFLLGLSLLAVNHDWAERWLETAKHKGKSLKQTFFPNTRWIRRAYDIVAITIMLGSGYIIITNKNRLLDGAATIALTFSLFLFLLNRDRLGKISDFFKHKK
jgi:hypothetical protein